MTDDQGGNDSVKIAGTSILEQIATHGDVVLEVGRDVEDAPAQMLVSSAVLSMASRSFAALLGPRFQEGRQDRSTGSPALVALPDDQPQAMSDMCNLLHLRDVPELQVCEPERIVALAVVIDKYCCVDALRLAMQGLVSDALEDECGQADPSYTIQIATAAYLLNQRRAFTIATRLMLLHSTTQFSELRKMEGGKLFPMNALLYLEERRSLFFEQLGIGLHADGGDHGVCEPCQKSSLRRAFTEFVCAAFDTRIWPPSFLTGDISIANALDLLKDIGTFESGAGCKLAGYCAELLNDRIIDTRQELEAPLGGLCLQCVKEDCIDLGCITNSHQIGLRLRVEYPG